MTTGEIPQPSPAEGPNPETEPQEPPITKEGLLENLDDFLASDALWRHAVTAATERYSRASDILVNALTAQAKRKLEVQLNRARRNQARLMQEHAESRDAYFSNLTDRLRHHPIAVSGQAPCLLWSECVHDDIKHGTHSVAIISAVSYRRIDSTIALHTTHDNSPEPECNQFRIQAEDLVDYLFDYPKAWDFVNHPVATAESEKSS